MFNVGDVVRCVDSDSAENLVTEGEYYDVVDVEEDCYLTFVGDAGHYATLHSRRFESIPQKPSLQEAPPDFQTQCDQIMDWFNFGKVEQAMQALGWTWHSSENFNKIPSESELRVCARDLLKRAHESGGRIGTGGFCAECCEGLLSLKFVLTEWSIE